MLFDESTSRPSGSLKLADVPVAFVEPALPEPANVETLPPDVILRILLLPASATYRFPDESNTSPCGWLNWAPVPKPFVEPAVVCPANVVTEPPGEILRIMLLLVSPTYT